jgi:hypothetical protein
LPAAPVQGSRIELLLKSLEANFVTPQTYSLWVDFFKSPPEVYFPSINLITLLIELLETFESVPPSEKTQIASQIEDIIINYRQEGMTGLITAYFEDGEFDVSLKGIPAEAVAHVFLGRSGLFFIDDETDLVATSSREISRTPFMEHLQVI